MITLDVLGFVTWIFCGVLLGISLSIASFIAYIEFTTKEE